MKARTSISWRIVRAFGRDRVLLFEAMVALTFASLVIATLPFRNVMRLAEIPSANRKLAPEARIALRYAVQWAVSRGAQRIPWRAMCFPQALAAQWMLRRRGIASVLYYGAAPDDARGLIAHVWVCDGEIPVIGGAASAGMALLAKFPDHDSTL